MSKHNNVTDLTQELVGAVVESVKDWDWALFGKALKDHPDEIKPLLDDWKRWVREIVQQAENRGFQRGLEMARDPEFAKVLNQEHSADYLLDVARTIAKDNGSSTDSGRFPTTARKLTSYLKGAYKDALLAALEEIRGCHRCFARVRSYGILAAEDEAK